MKKLLLIGLLLVGCASSDNGVSNTSYRKVIQQASDNLVKIKVDVAEVMSADPVHSMEWKKAHMSLLSTTAILLSDTLTGDK